MTPADLIETALREHLRLRLGKRAFTDAMLDKPIMLSGGEAESAARIALDALAGAGMVVVSAEDVEDAIDALAEREGVCCGAECCHELCVRARRLRAALPERTDHA